MSEYFIGEIRMFGGNYAPVQWAMCNGQLLPIDQNDALFSLIGTTYGGDGRTTFQLPDLRGRVPVHMGAGPGLTNRIICQKFGTESVTLTVDNLPTHMHGLTAASGNGTSNNPSGNILAASTGTVSIYNSGSSAPVKMNPAAVGNTGGSQSHSNLMPTLCVNFIISLYGIYPSRS
jgi:microcystin-dependent protein